MQTTLTGSPSKKTQVSIPVTIPEKKSGLGSWQQSLYNRNNFLGRSKDLKYEALLDWQSMGECDSSVAVLIRQEEKEIEKALLYDGVSACEQKTTFEKEESLINERVRKANGLLAKYGFFTPEYTADCHHALSCPLKDGRLLSIDYSVEKLLVGKEPLHDAKIILERYPKVFESPEEFFPYCPWVGGITQSGNSVSVQINYMSFGPDGFNKDPEVWTFQFKD